MTPGDFALRDYEKSLQPSSERVLMHQTEHKMTLVTTSDTSRAATHAACVTTCSFLLAPQGSSTQGPRGQSGLLSLRPPKVAETTRSIVATLMKPCFDRVTGVQQYTP